MCHRRPRFFFFYPWTDRPLTLQVVRAGGPKEEFSLTCWNKKTAPVSPAIFPFDALKKKRSVFSPCLEVTSPHLQKNQIIITVTHVFVTPRDWATENTGPCGVSSAVYYTSSVNAQRYDQGRAASCACAFRILALHGQTRTPIIIIISPKKWRKSGVHCCCLLFSTFFFFIVI